jgi:hypothetical protein
LDNYLTLVVAHLGEIELLQVTAKIPQPDQIFWSTKDNDWSVAVTELPVLAYLKGHHVGEALRGLGLILRNDIHGWWK